MQVFKKIKEVDEKEMVKLPGGGEFFGFEYVSAKALMDEPAGFVWVDDFGLGDSKRWGIAWDEFQLILKGKAEMTWSGGSPLTGIEEKTVIMEAGDACFLHRGDQVRWKIIDAPYRKLCVGMPAMPLPSGDHLTSTTYEAYKKAKGFS